MNSGIPFGERPESHRNIMGNTEQPWVHVDAVNFLFQNIKKSHTGFEFGSGSSTFWFSKFTKKIFSVESDEEWYKKTSEKRDEFDIKNIDISLVVCPMLKIWDIDTEIGEDYEKYSNEILKAGKKFDYISIDGVARSLCIKKSIDLLKPGGYLIIDNSERPAYWGAMECIPKNWESFIFTNPVDQTSIFKKPF